jgi:hypothetical protein
MVNLISNESKTGCYLLPILSNLQAPIFKNNTGIAVIAGIGTLSSPST